MPAIFKFFKNFKLILELCNSGNTDIQPTESS